LEYYIVVIVWGFR